MIAQQEFYSLPEVIKLIDIQKTNPHGSKEHFDSYMRIYDIAIEYGVDDKFAKSRESRIEEY